MMARRCFTTFAAACASLLAVIAWASPSYAQSGASANGFCTLVDNDLLFALEGEWTIQQRDGAAYAAGTRIPLPPPPATAVRFRFDGQNNVMVVVSADFTESMAMFPVRQQQQAVADAFIAPAGSPAANANCDWNLAPTLIATNYYYLIGTSYFSLLCDERDWGIGGCENEARAQRATPENVLKKNEPSVDLQMTLFLRFTGPNRGSGMVYFSGNRNAPGFAGANRFRASAPVTISR